MMLRLATTSGQVTKCASVSGYSVGKNFPKRTITVFTKFFAKVRPAPQGSFCQVGRKKKIPKACSTNTSPRTANVHVRPAPQGHKYFCQVGRKKKIPKACSTNSSPTPMKDPLLMMAAY